MPAKSTDQPKRVALYARVSTLDKEQDPETLLRPLRKYADQRGFQIEGEQVNAASGTSEDRALQRVMIGVARKRKLDVVLVWRYDRFACSTQALVNALKEFQSLGVDSTRFGDPIQSSLISQRVRAGMARAKAQHKHAARPLLVAATQDTIHALFAEGVSINQISKRTGVANGTVYKSVKQLKTKLLPGRQAVVQRVNPGIATANRTGAAPLEEKPQYVSRSRIRFANLGRIPTNAKASIG